MTPEETISRLTSLLSTMSAVTEDGAYAAMSSAGIPDREADLAYKFLQIACGRAVLDGMGIRFSDEYFCVNGAGDVVESGAIAQQPYFIAASRQIAQAPGEWTSQLAMMSADLLAVNEALKNGSNPADLETSPALLFLEMPTEEGMKKVTEFLTMKLSTDTPDGPKRSWWKFWQR